MPLSLFALPLQIFGLIFSIVFSSFLFWRQAKYELYSDREIFDILFIGSLGGLIGGRLTAFLVDFEKFDFSVFKLIFFHVFPGFNFYGFVIGALLSCSILLRRRRQQSWKLFDLAAAPLIFGLFTNTIFLILSKYLSDKTLSYEHVFYSIAMLLLFFVIKRLESLKRHAGYFVCYFLVFVTFTDMLFQSVGTNFFSVRSLYSLAVPTMLLIFGIATWYRLAKRRLRSDAKRVGAFFLLRIFAFFRIIKSADEAGRISRVIILSPYTVPKTFLVLLKGLFREIKLGFLNLIYTLGVKR